ncbi:MAG: hypothetical protein B7X11_02415 [Acidobacteria bacterium 37-65-4]|nr:MAG: hypothetical protein B7X11_02415 [Acidobacteria bacterium 37-65-4]
MDPRVSEIATGALKRLGAAPKEGGGSLPAELRIGAISLPQLSRLAYLQAGDPLVDQVLAMLRAGRPVFLDRPAVEASLGLGGYPARVREQFARWFIRISGYGVALTGGSAAQDAPAAARPAPPPESPVRQPAPAAGPPPVQSLTLLRPDGQILSEILGEAVPEPHPCYLEPGKACCGSGRCKTLGF